MKKGDWIAIFKAFLKAQGVLSDFMRLFKEYNGKDHKNLSDFYKYDKTPRGWVEEAFPWTNDGGDNGHEKWEVISNRWKERYNQGA